MLSKNFSFISPNIPIAIYVLDDKPEKNKYSVFSVEQYLKSFNLNIVATYCDYDGLQSSSNRSGFHSMLNDMKNTDSWYIVIIDCEASIRSNPAEYIELLDAMHQSHKDAYIIDKRVKP